MSDETKVSMEAAIQAHIADEFEHGDDILLTDYVLACAAVRMDPSAEINSTTYSWWSNGGAFHAMRGLVTMLEGWMTEADQ
jgi:hypothetical protein